MPSKSWCVGAVRIAALLLAGVAACGPRYALGGGAALVTVSTGGDDDQSFAPVLAARLGVPRTGGVLLAVDVQPVPARNPNVDESVSSAFVLGSLSIPTGPVRLGAGAGPSLHLWTGSDPAETMSLGLAYGGFIEVRRSAASPWALEAFARWADGNEFSVQAIGVQVLRYVR